MPDAESFDTKTNSNQTDTIPTQANSLPPQPGDTPRTHKVRNRLTLIVLLLVILIAALLLITRHHASNKAATAQKDVSLFRYGGTSGEVPKYPVKATTDNLDIEIEQQLFEGLTVYQNQTKVVPLLATSWSNPDDSTWIFQLRRGVKFHSGRTMTSADVVYSLNYALAHQHDDDDNTVLFLAATIKQVTAVNQYEVKITTNGPDPVLLNRLVYLGIVDSHAKLGDYDAGTGPYIVKPGTTPTQSNIDLAAFDRYWGGHVQTREAKVTIYTDPDQLAAATAAGKFDLAGDFTVGQMAQIKHHQTLYAVDQGLSYLGVNTERPTSPLYSIAARQALANALNIPAILKAAGLQGGQANQLVPLLLPGHNPSIPNTPYDSTKAKELLASVKNATTPLTLAYPTGDPPVNEIIKELTAVGFNIKPVPVDDFTMLINDTNAGKYDLFYLSYSSNTVDGLDILSTLLVGNQLYSNPEVDNLIAQAGNTLDSSARIKLMQKVANIIQADKPFIPLYTVNRAWALTKPYVVKMDIPSIGPYFWKIHQ